MTSRAEKPKVQNSVFWYTCLCMLAGVALAQMEVSTWLTFMLEVSSQLFERISDVLIAIFNGLFESGIEKPE